MYPELLLYLVIGRCSNSTIARWSANQNSMIDTQKINNAPLSKRRTRMDETFNQTVKSTREKLFYLSNLPYLQVISSDWILVDQYIVLPCSIQYYACQYLRCIPGWITEWYLTREEEYCDETSQYAQYK